MSNYFKDWKKSRNEEIKLDLGSYYKFDGPLDNKNLHYFLAEELLVPRLNNSDKMSVTLISDY